MTLLRLKGTITPDRRLEVELPADIPVGVVDIIVEYAEESWTEAELEDLLAQPIVARTGPEIAAWLEANPPSGWEQIDDSLAWVQAQRDKQAAERRW